MNQALAMSQSPVAITATAAPTVDQEQLRRALHIALRIAPSHAAAEDAVQQAFCTTWDNRHSLRDPAAFWPYLIRSMMRLLWADSRALRRTAPDSALVEQQHSPQISVERRLEKAQQQRALREAIADLPDRRREVLELRLAGLRGEDVATALGISHATVRVTYHQALGELRRRLDGEHR